MIDSQAFALGFKEACARRGISSGVLLKAAGQIPYEDEYVYAQEGDPRFVRAHQAMGIAMGEPQQPSPTLGDFIQRLSILGKHGTPTRTRKPFEG